MSKFFWKKRDPKAPTERADFIVCWIKNLLSPSVKQGRLYLLDKANNACCLGVACETAGLEKAIYNNNNKKVYKFLPEFNEGSVNILPLRLCNFLETTNICEILTENPEYSKHVNYSSKYEKVSKILKGSYSLIYANDTGVSFYFIAKALWLYPEMFFEYLSNEEYSYITHYNFPTWNQYQASKKK